MKDPLDSFLIRFTFQIERNQAGGADGFAFVIQSRGRNALGVGGSGMGYQGIPKRLLNWATIQVLLNGIVSLAIEFDVYANEDRFEDPNGNHIRWVA
jgi:hypothetical protein